MIEKLARKNMWLLEGYRLGYLTLNDVYEMSDATEELDTLKEALDSEDLRPTDKKLRNCYFKREISLELAMHLSDDPPGLAELIKRGPPGSKQAHG